MVDQLRVLPSAALTPDLLADSRTLVVHAPDTTPIDRVEGGTVVSTIEAADDAASDATVVIDDWSRVGGDALPDRSSLAVFVEPWPLQRLLTAAEDPAAVLDQFDAAYAIVDPVGDGDAVYGPSAIETPEVTLTMPRTAVQSVDGESALTVRGVDRALDATAEVPDLGMPIGEASDVLADHSVDAAPASALAALLVRAEGIDDGALADRLAELTIAPGAEEAAERSLGLAPGTLAALPDAIADMAESVGEGADPDLADALDAILTEHDVAVIDRVFDRLLGADEPGAPIARSGGSAPVSVVETIDVAAGLADSAADPSVVAAATSALFDADLDAAGIRAGVARLVARLAGDAESRAEIAGEGIGQALADRDADREAVLAGAIEAIAPSAWPAFVAGVQTTPDAGLDATLVGVLVDRLVEAVDPIRAPPAGGVDAIADVVVTAAARSGGQDPLDDAVREVIEALDGTAVTPKLAIAVIEAVDRRLVTDETPDQAGDVDQHPLADRVLALTTVTILDAIGRGEVTAPKPFAERISFDHEPSTKRLYRAGLQANQDGEPDVAREVLRAAWNRHPVLVPGTIDHDFALAAGAVYAGRLAIADRPGWPAEGVLAELDDEPGSVPDGASPIIGAIDDDRPRPDLEDIESTDAPSGSLDALEADVVADITDQLVDPPGPGEFFEMGCRAVINDDARLAVNAFGSAWSDRSATETEADEWAAIAAGIAMLAHTRIDVISPTSIYQPAVSRQVDTNRELIPAFVLDVYDGFIAEDGTLPDPVEVQAPVDLDAIPDREDLARLAFARIVARLEQGGSELESRTYPSADDEDTAADETDREALIEGLDMIAADKPEAAVDPLLDAWDDRSDGDPERLVAGAILGVVAQRADVEVIADEVVPVVRENAGDAPRVLDPVIGALDGDDPDVSAETVREQAAELPEVGDRVAEAVIALFAD
ncbi:MAG: hypothetical protein ACOCYZ_01120 [Halococcoides sp.]